MTLWEALVCMTEIDSKECPPHSPPQNDCTHFHHVFPKVLFWICQLPNHKFQRLLSDYLMKSKFGNLSRQVPSIQLIFPRLSQLPHTCVLSIFHGVELRLLHQSWSCKVFKILLKHHWSFSELLPSLSFFHTYFRNYIHSVSPKQMISLSWLRNIFVFCFILCYFYLKDLEKGSLHIDVKDDNIRKIININYCILEPSKALCQTSA